MPEISQNSQPPTTAAEPSSSQPPTIPIPVGEGDSESSPNNSPNTPAPVPDPKERLRLRNARKKNDKGQFVASTDRDEEEDNKDSLSESAFRNAFRGAIKPKKLAKRVAKIAVGRDDARALQAAQVITDASWGKLRQNEDNSVVVRVTVQDVSARGGARPTAQSGENYEVKG